MMPVEPNAVLGPVQLQQVLRKGISSTVYEGEHLRLGTKVSVHVLHASPADDRARFQREARAAARIRHPGVVRTLDFGEYQDLRYLVLQRVHGTTLEQHLAELCEPLPERVILRLVARLAEMLRVCHAAGVAHRNLSPAVLQIDRRGQLRVSEFGLAPATGPAPVAEGSFPEPSPYLPPQAASADPTIDAGADLFAVGVLAYQLAFQRLPYRIWTEHGASTGITLEPPRFDLPTHCSTGLLHVVQRLVHPDPGGRLTTAEELLEVLPREATEETRSSSRAAGAAARSDTEEDQVVRIVRGFRELFGRSTSVHESGEIVHSTLRDRLVVWALLFTVVALAGAGFLSAVR